MVFASRLVMAVSVPMIMIVMRDVVVFSRLRMLSVALLCTAKCVGGARVMPAQLELSTCRKGEQEGKQGCEGGFQWKGRLLDVSELDNRSNSMR